MVISSSKIRKQFIDYFINKDHKFVRSAPVAPLDDPTLLFTNAGMNQFKPYFLGIQEPEIKRAVNYQKCIRVSGKHNDLEEVGVDDYHHTFFEMLGNWSFGDYYKEDAIRWHWELLTDVWKLDKNRLWVTIFEDDDESRDIWEKNTDIHPNRILKFGHKDNFWEMGTAGPCGPCTEIHYYTGESLKNQSKKGVNFFPEYREICNLVFIQYNRDNNGKLKDLPQRHIDTGTGFERLVAILNGKSSNYDTDLFTPIINQIVELSGKAYNYKGGVPHRVIADHLRMLAFSIADGAMPSNDGRGYVLRRVLRRAARFGRILQMKEPFIYKLTDIVAQIMGESYPEIKEKQKHIEKVIKSEESSFNDTLDRGLVEYNKITKDLSSNDLISGEEAFKLYDTYGFPLDLTELIAKEDGFSIDIDKFNNCMIEQKGRARSKNHFQYNSKEINWVLVGKEKSTDFIGYEQDNIKSNIIQYNENDDFCSIVLDKTPFYAESGGQIGDKGIIKADNFEFSVEDVQKYGNKHVHLGKIISGRIEKVGVVQAEINESHRNAIRRNHTATHLLHQSLKDVLGDHVQQAGSLVGEKFLRFDLTHYEKITLEQIRKIQSIVNAIILENKTVSTKITSYKEARENGAVSLFGEKYDDVVRVVNISGFSKELCGGTHVKRTGDIGCFKIISEESLAAGIRRIVAITGTFIPEFMINQEDLLRGARKSLQCSDEEIFGRLSALLEEKKYLERENKRFSHEKQTILIKKLIDSAKKIEGIKLIVEELDSIGDLKKMGDQFREIIKQNGIALIGTIKNNKPMIMCAVTDDVTEKINAGEIVKKISVIIGGGGGGKSHIATAGGSELKKLNSALDKGKKIIYSIIS